MTERLPKNHDARAQIESLPLEGKVPSAHTGRMRWKSCVFDGSGKVAPVGASIVSRETWVTHREERWVTVFGCGD